MGDSYPKIRLYVEAPLHAGAQVPFSADQSHYVLQVMRATEGEPIALFNGQDGEWQGRLTPISRKKAEAIIENPLRPQTNSPDVWYGFAPIKHGRIDFSVQKATELGASTLMPIMTARTQASRVNTGRLQANAVEAAEQSERLDVPPVAEPQTLAKWLDALPKDRLLLYGDEAGQGQPPHTLFASLPASERWALLVGPEGGFSPEEFERLRSMENAKAVSLGPRILRADTAGLALLTCLMAWRGDWDSAPDFKYKG